MTNIQPLEHVASKPYFEGKHKEIEFTESMANVSVDAMGRTLASMYRVINDALQEDSLEWTFFSGSHYISAKIVRFFPDQSRCDQPYYLFSISDSEKEELFLSIYFSERILRSLIVDASFIFGTGSNNSNYSIIDPAIRISELTDLTSRRIDGDGLLFDKNCHRHSVFEYSSKEEFLVGVDGDSTSSYDLREFLRESYMVGMSHVVDNKSEFENLFSAEVFRKFVEGAELDKWHTQAEDEDIDRVGLFCSFVNAANNLYIQERRKNNLNEEEKKKKKDEQISQILLERYGREINRTAREYQSATREELVDGLSYLLVQSKYDKVIRKEVERVTAPDELSDESKLHQADPLAAIFHRADEIEKSLPRGRPDKGVDMPKTTRTTVSLDDETLTWLGTKPGDASRRIRALITALREAEGENPSP